VVRASGEPGWARRSGTSHGSTSVAVETD